MDKRKKRAQKDKRRQDALRKARAARPSSDPEELERALSRSHKAINAGQPQKAETILRKALKGAPDDPKLLGNLVAALEPQGRLADAVTVARRGAAAQPEFAGAHHTLGVVLKFSGDLDESAASFRRAVELEPRNAEFWRNLASVKRFSDPADPDLAAMHALLEKLPTASDGRVELHFTLGQAYEQLEDFERSFEHYAKGNKQKRARLTYHREELETLVDSTIAFHAAEYLNAGVSEAVSDAAPILIVGLPRSGSTLVEQILASHPDVEGVGEVPDLSLAINEHIASPATRAETVAGWSADEHARIGRAYAERLHRRTPEALRTTDKFLINYLHIGFLSRALPNARIVHCVREAADNCFSAFKVLFTSPVFFSYDLAELAHTYTHVSRLMAHWHAQLPGRVLDVRYDELVGDFDGQARRLLEHCGLEWNDACARFHETRRRVNSASATQVRQPLYGSSVAKWRKYEQHLGPLLDALGEHAPERRS